MKLRPTKKKKLNDNEIAVSDSDVNKSTNTHNESDEQPQVTEQPDTSEGMKSLSRFQFLLISRNYPVKP